MDNLRLGILSELETAMYLLFPLKRDHCRFVIINQMTTYAYWGTAIWKAHKDSSQAHTLLSKHFMQQNTDPEPALAAACCVWLHLFRHMPFLKLCDCHGPFQHHVSILRKHQWCDSLGNWFWGTQVGYCLKAMNSKHLLYPTLLANNPDLRWENCRNNSWKLLHFRGVYLHQS